MGDEAKKFGISDDFLRRMTGRFVGCFRRLDQFGQDDPFWEGTNRRPTRSKMDDFCRKMADDTPDDRHVRLKPVSVQVLVGHYFDSSTWERLVSEDRSPASWPVDAALIAVCFGGYETAPEVVRLLKDSGLCNEARPAIVAFTEIDVAWVRDWASTILNGCD